MFTSQNNPILESYRDAIYTDLYTHDELAYVWVNLLRETGSIPEPGCEDASPAQVEHAIRVLSRIDRLF